MLNPTRLAPLWWLLVRGSTLEGGLSINSRAAGIQRRKLPKIQRFQGRRIERLLSTSQNDRVCRW